MKRIINRYVTNCIIIIIIIIIIIENSNTGLGLPTSKITSNPITGLDWPKGFQEVEDPIFQDIRHMKVVKLSVLSTGRLYPPGNIPSTHFC